MKTHGAAQGIMMEHPALDEKLPFYRRSHAPRLFAIDDYSLETLDFTQAMDAIKGLGLDSRLNLVKSSFVGAASKLGWAPRALLALLVLSSESLWCYCGIGVVG